MPIQLTTPVTYPGGHGQPTETYTQVKIVEFVCAVEEKSLRVRCQYGNTIDGTWQPGRAEQAIFVAADRPAQLINGEAVAATFDYSALVVASKTLPTDVLAPGDGGHNCYVGTARELYEWLLEKGYYQGRVV
jgi:hypothetical protein